ncbi:hypothetical protein B0H11DRAFT_1938194 [Mycena galericulata]|nr:hypothetical protein B0H11DRAFT_1938194 [Mycena galericulata]
MSSESASAITWILAERANSGVLKLKMKVDTTPGGPNYMLTAVNDLLINLLVNRGRKHKRREEHRHCNLSGKKRIEPGHNIMRKTLSIIDDVGSSCKRKAAHRGPRAAQLVRGKGRRDHRHRRCIESGLRDRREAKLYAPVYNGLAVGLSFVFIGSGVKTLLVELTVDGSSISLPLLLSASFIALLTLYAEVTARIVFEMAHGLFSPWRAGGRTFRKCTQRIPRIRASARSPSAPDVADPVLKRSSRRALVGLFGAGWLTPEFAGLPPKLHAAVLKGLQKRCTPANPLPILYVAERVLQRISSMVEPWVDVRLLLEAREGNAGKVYQALVNVLLPHSAPTDETAFPTQPLLSQTRHVSVQVEQARTCTRRLRAAAAARRGVRVQRGGPAGYGASALRTAFDVPYLSHMGRTPRGRLIALLPAKSPTRILELQPLPRRCPPRGGTSAVLIAQLVIDTYLSVAADSGGDADVDADARLVDLCTACIAHIKARVESEGGMSDFIGALLTIEAVVARFPEEGVRTVVGRVLAPLLPLAGVGDAEEPWG